MRLPAEVLLVTGKWASGKTYAASLLAAAHAHRGPLRFVSDRTALEDGVFYDHGMRTASDQPRRRPRHSDVSRWGPRGKVQFTVSDGYLYHVARTEIVRAMRRHLDGGEGVLVAEVAIGPDVRRAPGPFGAFAQTTEGLVGALEEAGVRGDGQNATFVQLDSPLETRLDRQGVRSDKTAQDAFLLYAGEGGELVRHAGDAGLVARLVALGWRVRLVRNEGLGPEGLAAALGVAPLSVEEARATYERLVSPCTLVSIPPEAFSAAEQRLLEAGGVNACSTS